MNTIQQDVFIRKNRQGKKTDSESTMDSSSIKNETELADALSTYSQGAVLMMTLPTEQYFPSITSTIKTFTEIGFEGVYVSFQRPFINIFSVFQNQGINVDKLFIIDGATACCDTIQAQNPRCVSMSSPMNSMRLTNTICRSLSQLKSKQRFVCIDSLSTMALYKPFSDPVNILEMVQMVQNLDFNHVMFLLNIADDLLHKPMIKEIARYADGSFKIQVCS